MTAALGARIRQARDALQLSQKALATRTGITASDLSQIENGHVEPRAFTLRCLAQALEVSTDYLLGLSETPTAGR